MVILSIMQLIMRTCDWLIQWPFNIIICNLMWRHSVGLPPQPLRWADYHEAKLNEIEKTRKTVQCNIQTICWKLTNLDLWWGSTNECFCYIMKGVSSFYDSPKTQELDWIATAELIHVGACVATVTCWCSDSQTYNMSALTHDQHLTAAGLF